MTTGFFGHLISSGWCVASDVNHWRIELISLFYLFTYVCVWCLCFVMSDSYTITTLLWHAQPAYGMHALRRSHRGAPGARYHVHRVTPATMDVTVVYTYRTIRGEAIIIIWLYKMTPCSLLASMKATKMTASRAPPCIRLLSFKRETCATSCVLNKKCFNSYIGS